MQITVEYLDQVEKSLTQQKEQATSLVYQCIGGLQTVEQMRVKLKEDSKESAAAEIAKAEAGNDK